MQHDNDPLPDDMDVPVPASETTRESETTNDYPWLDDDFEDADDPEELDLDDPYWDAFLADDDELDPEPAPGDFWPEGDCE